MSGLRSPPRRLSAVVLLLSGLLPPLSPVLSAAGQASELGMDQTMQRSWDGGGKEPGTEVEPEQ